MTREEIERFADSPVPIGKPVANTALLVLDDHLNLVPPGAVGELCVAGDGVGCGYIHAPELTAERFLPNPFARRSGEQVLYRTGDLARFLPNGNLEFLGRKDHQVKVRGYRIELSEIEMVLGQHPGVRLAAVLARENLPGEKQLVGYIVPSGSAPSPEQLRSFLRGKLPDYMVPAIYVSLTAMPITASGKIDRLKLPAPDLSHMEAGPAQTGEEPSTPAEKALAGVWARVLGVPLVGLHDDFFALGGDSILGVQVIAQARQAGFQLTPRQLFENPTIAALAAVAGVPAIPDPDSAAKAP